MKISLFKKSAKLINDNSLGILIINKSMVPAVYTLQNVALQEWHQGIVPLLCPLINSSEDIKAVLTRLSKDKPITIILDEFDKSNDNVRNFILNELILNRDNYVHKSSKIVLTSTNESETYTNIDMAILDKLFTTTLEND